MDKPLRNDKLVKSHFNCDSCGSSDARSLYYSEEKEVYYTKCFSCGKEKHVRNEDELEDINRLESKSFSSPKADLNDVNRLAALSHGGVGPIKDRGLSKDTVEKYGVTLKVKDGRIARHIYPYYNSDGEHVANKVRYCEEGVKGFSAEGQLGAATLFGQHIFPKGSARYLTICEGEVDAMSVWEMSGGKSPAVSIKNGAASVLRDLADPEVYDYLNSFENIIVAFDADRAGQEAARKFCEAFTPGKCKVLEYHDGIKDANDYLKAGRIADFTKAWWNAKPYAPENIKNFGMLKDSVLNPPDIETFDYPWTGLQEIAHGQRLHEFVVWKADTGVGKTQLTKELEYYNGMNHNKRVGIIHLEEPDHQTARGLCSIYLNVPLHLYTDHPKKEIEAAFNAIESTGNFYLYDSFGAEDVDAIVSKIRYMVVVLGCTFIFLDHIHMVASDAGESERIKLDELGGKLKKSTMEMPYILHGIVHTNDEGQTRGTRVIDKLANMVFHLKRDKQATDPRLRNKTEVSCEKNRFSGETGICGYLDYNKVTGRMQEGMSPQEEGLV